MSTSDPNEPNQWDDPPRPSDPGAGRDVAQVHDLADDAITVGGDEQAGEPRAAGRAGVGERQTVERRGAERADDPAVGRERGRRLVDPGHRAQMATGSAPNGWFAGPHADPDRFELLGSGLAGGEGNTWRGRYRGELTVPLTLAVKELRRPPHAPPGWPTPADLRRWNDQRALLQYMRIDHLVTVIDIFVGPAPHLPGAARTASGDTPYVVMEWVPGPTLADELSGVPAAPSTLDQRLAHVQHVAEALHSLHSQTASAGNPTLHRDVKPTNCILDPRRGVVLVDVGTMRRMDDGYDHDGFHTPAYTAPEVLANPQAARAVASDLYSLGALAYFCVVGEDPPVSDQPEAGEQVHTRLLAAARMAGVADVNGFVNQVRLMLDPVPHQRPADARSWSRRLRSLAAVRRRPSVLPRSRRARTAVGSGIAALVLVVGAAGFLRAQGDAEPTAAGAGSRTGALPGSPNANFSAPPGSAPGLGAVPRPAEDGPGASPPSGLPEGPYGPGHPIRTRFATITTPRDGQPAPLCTTVTGISKLPAGQTILTAVVNESLGDEIRHLQVVRGWERPASLRTWEGVQFIGLPQEPVGGRFRIEVIMAPLAGLKQQIQASGGERGHWRSQFPAGGRVVASAFVTRSAAAGAPGCVPPPLP